MSVPSLFFPDRDEALRCSRSRVPLLAHARRSLCPAGRREPEPCSALAAVGRSETGALCPPPGPSSGYEHMSAHLLPRCTMPPSVTPTS